jgi:hypothetical protein
MARKVDSTDPVTSGEDPVGGAVVSGDGVILPPTAPPVQSDNSPSAVVRTGGRKLTATEAGSASPLFPAGGSAFGVWCLRQGIPATERRTATDWGTLLTEFASRPVHGHHRGEGGRLSKSRKV